MVNVHQATFYLNSELYHKKNGSSKAAVLNGT